MAKITVEIDGVLYSKERIQNTEPDRIIKDIKELEHRLLVYQGLIDSGIFDKEFKS